MGLKGAVGGTGWARTEAACCTAAREGGLGWWGGRTAEASNKEACIEATKGRPHIKSGHI